MPDTANAGNTLAPKDCFSPGTRSAVVFHDYVTFSETPNTRHGPLINEVQDNASGEHYTLTQWTTPAAVQTSPSGRSGARTPSSVATSTSAS